MQKLISLFLISILTILPILSASASVNYCQHSTPQSTLSNLVQTSAVETAQAMDMSNTHDCCTSNSICDHGACDCDYSQAAYSFSKMVQVSVVPSLSEYKESISNFFISKNSDSLYRPPISIL